MTITTEISIGEFLDKLTILQIKQERIGDPEKLINISKELDALLEHWKLYEQEGMEIGNELEALRLVNEKLWETEDLIREKEAAGKFDQEFIALARSVYITNDERSRIKKTINQKLHSGFIEEKSYKDYQAKKNE